MSNYSPFSNQARFTQHVGLERITKLCHLLGDPQFHFRAIHVAGTNGKGSTCAFIASILQSNGYRVGLFTSPHLVDYRERFCINGQMIAPDELERIAADVQHAMAQVVQSYPEYGSFTEFEATTALGFVYFAQQQVDFAVIEVGLGGRLDATNIVHPLLSVITPIGHDHLERLGPTLEDVAREKAGIIKPGVPVVSSGQVPEVAHIIQMTAAKQHAPYYGLSEAKWQPINWDLKGGLLQYPYFGQEPFSIRLLGSHQLENAATALLSMEVLAQKGIALQPKLIRQGLLTATWPGRLQVISHNPLVLLDGAHNREGILALASALSMLKGTEQKITFIIGLSAHKEPELLDPLFPLAQQIYFTEARNYRVGVVPAQQLCAYAQSKGLSAQVIALEEVKNVLKGTGPFCICGSLYLVGDVQALLSQGNKGVLQLDV